MNDLKVLTRISEASFLSFIFRYIFRIVFISNKVFYFSQINVFLLLIFLKFIFSYKEKRGFIWLKTFFISNNFLFQKHSIFYLECFLRITVPEYQNYKKVTFNFSKVFEK